MDDRLGDFDTEMVQELAESIAKKHLIEAHEGLGNGLRIVTDGAKFRSRVQVFDGASKVFDATKYADGDQIVSHCVPGNWRKRLSACA